MTKIAHCQQDLRLGAAVMIVLLCASQASGGEISAPKGCTAYLTVQMKSCVVEHHWTCEGDPEGYRWQLTLDERGPRYLSLLDAEYRWIEAWPQRTGIHRQLVIPESDASSLTQLLETGYDTYDFDIRREQSGKALKTEHVTGFDRLTGETAIIDGETLLITEFGFDSILEGEDTPVRVSGRQFISDRFKTFFSGREVEETAAGRSDYDLSPVKFYEPGEQGFMSDTPVFDCGAVISRLPVPSAKKAEMKETHHAL